MTCIYLVKDVSPACPYGFRRTKAFKTIEQAYHEMKGKRSVPIVDDRGHEITPENLDKHLTYTGMTYKFYQTVYSVHVDMKDCIPVHKKAHADLYPDPYDMTEIRQTTETYEFELTKVEIY